jgi:hypothetical protein
MRSHHTYLKAGVWCGVSCQDVIGPLFCSEIVNVEYYQQLIRQLISAPVLLSPDFYLWGFLTDNVCRNNRHTLELKQDVEMHIKKLLKQLFAMSHQTCLKE